MALWVDLALLGKAASDRSGQPRVRRVALCLASKRPLDRARKRSRPLRSLGLAVLRFKARLRFLKFKHRRKNNAEDRHAGVPFRRAELDAHVRGFENVKQRMVSVNLFSGLWT
jgi:hypothetical protein